MAFVKLSLLPEKAVSLFLVCLYFIHFWFILVLGDLVSLQFVIFALSLAFSLTDIAPFEFMAYCEFNHSLFNQFINLSSSMPSRSCAYNW